MALQTILGSGGAIGSPLTRELLQFTQRIRLVSRNPKKINATDELFAADITDAAQLDKAIQGSSVVYLCVGFEYNSKVWQKQWPNLMRNTIASCKKHKAKLVFFDNVYMYDPKHLYHMTEDTPVSPCSKKGKVRAAVAQMLLSAVEKGELIGQIARAADFLGPRNSIPVELVYNKLAESETANWFSDAHKVHTFTFTPDAARATALLGNTPDAYNQVWHLPTDQTPLTGKQWIELFAKEMQAEPDFRVVPSWLLGIMGLFKPIMKELKEMNYQYDRDYLFNSSKFESRFGIKPTPPAEAVKQTILLLESQ